MLSFVQNNGLSRFTFWSVNRDRQCKLPDNNGSTSSECSSVTQNAWDFTAYTVAFVLLGLVALISAVDALRLHPRAGESLVEAPAR